MIELIQSIDGWQTKTASEIADLLNTKSVPKTDNQLYTWAGVALIAGPEGAETLRVVMEQNGMGWVVHQLGGSGIQLSNPQVQQALQAFAQMGVPGAMALAETGFKLVSPMQNAALEPATADQVETALQVFETSNWWTAVQSVVKEKLFAGEVTTIDGIKEIVEGA